jgi:hypothetical protein
MIRRRCHAAQFPSESSEQKKYRRKRMFGWLTVFALLTAGSPLTALIGKEAAVPAAIGSVLFGFLFCLCLLTCAVRGRA